MAGTLTYKRGNLFDHLEGKTNIIVPHVCNTLGVMGSGFAAQVREKYPETNETYVKYCKHFKLNNPTYYRPYTLFTYENFGVFCNMICQTGLSGSQVRNATYTDLIKCMDFITDLDSREWEVYAPKFGAGLCGMNWDFIEELIKDIWLTRGYNVTIFTN